MIPDRNYPNFTLLWSIDFVATLLSIFGSLWMIISCLRMPSPKSLSLKLILAIACSDFMYSLANVFSNFQQETGMGFCKVEAVIRQCAFVLSIYFSTCTAIASYNAAYPRRQLNKATSFFFVAVIFGFLLCILMVFIMPLFVNSDIIVQEGPLFCWYTSTKDAKITSKYMILMIFQGFPIIIGLLVTILGYALAIRAMRKLPNILIQASGFNIYQVLWYPVLFFISFVPAFWNSLEHLDDNKSPLWVVASNLGLTHLIGFTNALLYGLQRRSFKVVYDNDDEEDRIIEGKLMESQTFNTSSIVTDVQNSTAKDLYYAYGSSA